MSRFATPAARLEWQLATRRAFERLALEDRAAMVAAFLELLNGPGELMAAAACMRAEDRARLRLALEDADRVARLAAEVAP